MVQPAGFSSTEANSRIAGPEVGGSHHGVSRVDDQRRPWALAVADVGWFTTNHLFGAGSGQGGSILGLTCLDYGNAWRAGRRPWIGPSNPSRAWNRPIRREAQDYWRADLALPSGWMKRFPEVGMRPIARLVRRWRRGLANNTRFGLVMTYPHYLVLRRQLRPDFSIYYNVDDYTLYWPGQAETIRALEIDAVRASALTVCVAGRRAEELRERVPDAADRIVHLPHGCPADHLASETWRKPAVGPDSLQDCPRPWLGFIGSLEDRVDWSLLERQALARPDATIVLVGRITADLDEPWCQARARCLALKNVKHLGWCAQDQVASHYASFDVCLIPYRVDHPFNLACCPTKIMDAMGSGRPIVSTALPECLLHRERFDVESSTEEFLSAVDRVLAAGSDDGRAEARHSYAQSWRCDRVFERLMGHLNERLGLADR